MAARRDQLVSPAHRGSGAQPGRLPQIVIHLMWSKRSPSRRAADLRRTGGSPRSLPACLPASAVACALLIAACGSSTRTNVVTAKTPQPARNRICTAIWVGPRRGEFGTARDWSTGRVPGPGDVACAPRSVAILVSHGHYVVSALIAGGKLTVSGGFLSLHDNCIDSELGNVLISGGVLNVGKCSTGPSIDYCTPYSPRLRHCVTPNDSSERQRATARPARA